MKEIKTILIANRGEIASRIIRTCRKMGITTVAVFSDADRKALFVKEADLALYLGASNPTDSYLNEDKIFEAAKKINADAIHPGYGFLSENASFARRCEKQGIIFIGPNPNAIDAMGSKSRAKHLMMEHNVPVVRGYQGKDQSNEKLTLEANKIGFPLLLKASAGGGGKGMRIVENKSELQNAIESAKRESQSSFGDNELIIEKYIASGRHIEFQIFGDQHGKVLHLFERECTIQRRYQKVIEESPSSIMTDELRDEMAQAALQAAKALHYDNAGTVEFIYDDKTGDFYFLEVNTRLQVEHPVTEAITGLDLVKMQIESAQGIPLSLNQDEVSANGYALECRLYAEDPSNNFLPVTGTIHQFKWPAVDGLRVDTAIAPGSEISVFYDPMIAKLIVWDDTRQGAHRKMEYALSRMVCQGMQTNQDFLLQVVKHKEFQKGNYNTHFISIYKNEWLTSEEETSNCFHAAIAATCFAWQKKENKRGLLKSIPSGWRNNFYEPQKQSFLYGDKEITIAYRYLDRKFTIYQDERIQELRIVEVGDNKIILDCNGLVQTFNVTQKNSEYFVHNDMLGNFHLKEKERFPLKKTEKTKGDYATPMPSQIVKVLVSEGQKVEPGDALVVLSSMKMENTILAEQKGNVEEIYAKEGTNVEAGFLLLKLTAQTN